MGFEVGKAYVTVHLDFLLNGEPMTKILETPAEIEDPKDYRHGVVVHMHIDAEKMAQAIAGSLKDLYKK